ncbi:MAG: glycerol-3-phosphate dehydrogenase [Beijerinckiaceae bacterium]|nr:glycerol-3-phosphate dehydrogenase [Beijerinckiaceae bacterium]
MFDLAIIGGGINGCSIARDAAGRGLSVYLCERDDLAAGTSSRSTKLVHGGLRYLEHYEFRMVREALAERETLLSIAPHIIWPLRFVLPHQKGLRPAWLLRLGLFLYDHLGGRKILPATKTLDLRSDSAGVPLKAGFGVAFEYSDCWVEDSRLVVLNAMDARDRGATIETRSRLVSADRGPNNWTLRIEDARTGRCKELSAGTLVNTAGPWVADVLMHTIRSNAAAKVRLVQGSHIVVPKLFDHDRCYIFQNGDGRIVFAIPYEGEFTLIGTTDQDYVGDPAAVAATRHEIAYLCSAASDYFEKPVLERDVVWTYSGVRPLYDDGASKAQEITRDYVLKLDAPVGSAPLLSVFGGKITTARRLAEDVLATLDGHLPEPDANRAGWTATSALPGGDFAPDRFDDTVTELQRRYPFLAPLLARRLVRAYGTRAFDIVEGARSMADLGRAFGAGLTEAELSYLARHEWAETAEDVVWRRTKLGLRMSEAEIAAVDAWFGDRIAGDATARAIA